VKGYHADVGLSLPPPKGEGVSDSLAGIIHEATCHYSLRKQATARAWGVSPRERKIGERQPVKRAAARWFESSYNLNISVACVAGLALFVCSDLGLTPQALCCLPAAAGLLNSAAGS